MIELNRNIEELWMFLSDAWSRLEDKTTIEGMWETAASGMEMLLSKTMDIQNSRSLQYLPEIIDDGPLSYTFVYSGIDNMINVLPSDTGLFKYYLDDWTISIPTIIQEYTYLNSGVSHTYYENTDYTISGMNTLIWLTTPFWDERYSNIKVFTVSLPIVTRINPILLNAWARIVGIDLAEFNSYITYKENTLAAKYRHLKHLIWALISKQLAHPTIKTLQDGLSIAAGLPFAYEAGTVSYAYDSGVYTMTVGDEVYFIPSGLTPVLQGSSVDKFDLLVSGLCVWDYYNNQTLIQQYSNVLTCFNTVIVEKSIPLTYDLAFYEDYRDKLLPVQFHKIYLGF
jgi:hypothetical protein